MAGMADDMPCHHAKSASDKSSSIPSSSDTSSSGKACPCMVACLSLCFQGMPPVAGSIVVPTVDKVAHGVSRLPSTREPDVLASRADLPEPDFPCWRLSAGFVRSLGLREARRTPVARRSSPHRSWHKQRKTGNKRCRYLMFVAPDRPRTLPSARRNHETRHVGWRHRRGSGGRRFAMAFSRAICRSGSPG